MGHILAHRAQLAHSLDSLDNHDRQEPPGRMDLLVEDSPALDMADSPAVMDNPLPVVEEMDGLRPVVQVDRPAPEMEDKAYKRAGIVVHPRDRQGVHP